MNEQAASIKMVSKLLLRLLPVQVLLCAVNAVNGIVSSFFASNYVGIEAMSAVGLYAPIGMLVTTLSIILWQAPGPEPAGKGTERLLPEPAFVPADLAGLYPGLSCAGLL